jgi:hypothetical protein
MQLQLEHNLAHISIEIVYRGVVLEVPKVILDTGSATTKRLPKSYSRRWSRSRSTPARTTARCFSIHPFWPKWRRRCSPT